MPPLQRTCAFASILTALCAVGCMAVAAASENRNAHPRLFFGPEDVPRFQERAGKKPWSEMLRAVEWAMENDRAATYEGLNVRPANPAILSVFHGKSAGRDFAREALADALFLVFSPDKEGKPVWADPSCRSLTRSGRGVQVAIAYDLCHEAWKGLKIESHYTTRDGVKREVPSGYAGQEVNAFLSKKLLDNAESLVKSGGPGWPGDMKTGNNWHAVRFGGAALQYLACDEPREGWQKSFETAIRSLMNHKAANLSRQPNANGYNPEGIAYAQYPGWTTYPLVIALKRIEGRNLLDEIPAMRRELWATCQGVLPIPRRSRVDNPVTKGLALGLRPDFTDDHPVWDPEGTAALAFAVSPPEFLPGLKWIFRRLCGDLGDNTWDTSSGNGLYSLIFYPEEVEEKNPADVWGLTWRDDAFGMFLFRNRFKDEQDIVAQIVAKLRPTLGGHEGRDALSFRIMGLGAPWAVGSGRTSDHRGQTSLFPGDPEEGGTPPAGLVPAVIDTFLRPKGDGYVVLGMEMSDTGVSSHVRRFLSDFSGRSGAPALFVVSDTSEDGRFWRLNTPDFNRIEAAPNQFTITAPGGERLHAKILHPASGVQPRVGAFKRGSPYPFRDINLSEDPSAMGSSAYTTQNRWVDFESGDGRFLVSMTLLPAGVAPPDVSLTTTGSKQTIRAGNQTITIDGNSMTCEGWTRPALKIVSPADGAHFNGGAQEITFSGSATDPDGIEAVTISCDGMEPVRAQIKGDAWSATLPSVAPGPHEVRVSAMDRQAEETVIERAFQVNHSNPPVVELDAPKSDLNPGGTVRLTGKASDPDGGPVSVLLLAGGQPLGNATVNGETFTFAWENLPVGSHALTALATDVAGDSISSKTKVIRTTIPVGKGNVSDAASLWVGEHQADAVSPVDAKAKGGFHPRLGGTERWAIVEADGGRALRVRSTEKWDFANRHLWIIGSEKAKNWKLSWRMRMISPLEPDASALVHFGAGIAGPLAMDFRPINSSYREDRRGRKGTGTRLWYLAQNDNRNEIGWTHHPHVFTSKEPFGDVPRDFAGVPDGQWHSYSMERRGRRLVVQVDGREILSAENPWIASRGPVGFGNDRLTGHAFEISDIQFDPVE